MVIGRKKIAKIGSKFRNLLLCTYSLSRSDGLRSILMSFKYVDDNVTILSFNIFWSSQGVQMFGIWYDLIASVVTHNSTHFSGALWVKCL